MTRSDAEFSAALLDLAPHFASAARVEASFNRADALYVIAAIHLALRHKRFGQSAPLRRAGEVARRMGQHLAAEMPQDLAWAVEELVRRGESASQHESAVIMEVALSLARTVSPRVPQVVTLPGKEAPATLRQVIRDVAPGAAILCGVANGVLVALTEAEADRLRQMGAAIAPSPIPGPPEQDRPAGADARRADLAAAVASGDVITAGLLMQQDRPADVGAGGGQGEGGDADRPAVHLSRDEFVRALATLSRALHEKRLVLVGDLRRAAGEIERGGDATRVAFHLATQHRELRVLGGLLQQPEAQRRDRLRIEGGLDQSAADEVLGLLAELSAHPDLVKGLGWVLSPWFPTRAPTSAARGAKAPHFLIYVAGPYTAFAPHTVAGNIERAQKVAAQVAAVPGCFPVTPHLLSRGIEDAGDGDFWLAGTLAVALRCDALITVEGWEKSRGALAEVEALRMEGRPVFHTLAELAAWAAAPAAAHGQRTLGPIRPQCDPQAPHAGTLEALALDEAEAALRWHADALRDAVAAKLLRRAPAARYTVSTQAPDFLGHEPLVGLRRLVRQVGGEVLDVRPDALLCALAPAAHAQLLGCAAAFALVLEEDVQHHALASGDSPAEGAP